MARSELDFQQAMELHRSGDVDAAVVLYEKVLCANANHPGAWHLLGVAHLGRGEHQAAREKIERALSLCSTKAIYHNNYGAVLKELGDLQGAKAAFEEAVRINSEYPDALANLGLLEIELGNVENAEELLKQALKLDSRHVDALSHLARLFYEQHEADKASACYQRAISLQPDRPDLYNGLGGTYLVNRDWENATKAYRKATSLDPDYAEAWFNLSTPHMMEDRVEETQQCINRAAQLRPDKSLWKYRGLGLCSTVFSDTESIKDYRRNLEQQLNAVLKEKPKFDWRTVAEDGFRPSFQLAHHGLCNRRIMEKFAAIFSDAFPLRRCKTASHHRIRVGFVAMQHQIGNFLLWYGPLLRQLDRRKIEPFVLCPRQAVPQCKKVVINSEGIQWLDLSASMLKCIKQIEQAELDVLCYFQVGTDHLSYFLPFVRLAPIQCTSWGTLGTMGIPTIDSYISSSLTERVGAQDDYTERLCLFGGVPSHQVRDPSRILTEKQKHEVRKEHGLPKTGAIYLCPQKLVKFHPEFDLFLRGVLEADRDGTIILFQSSCFLGFEKLFKRFSRTIGEPLLHRLRVIPFQKLNAYRRVVATSDVILDSPHYSTSITGIDAFAAATPIVTLPGQLLVERFALGMYRQMGIFDLIAKDIADYVNLAVTLGTNIRYRRVISERIQDESKTLFDNPAVVREYESYFRGLQNGL